MLEAAQDQLQKMDFEGGHRHLSREEAVEQIKLLKQQMENDKAIIKDTTEALEAKKADWKVRIETRDAEQAAISKAIAILHGDDARDLFKKSFASQGYLLLQERMTSSSDADAEDSSSIADRAGSELRRIAELVPDNRLMPLISLMKGLKGPDQLLQGPEEMDGDLSELEDKPPPADGYVSVKNMFDPVIEAIDKMLALLSGDEEADLAIKEECEKGRMEDTRSAILSSRLMDEATDKIAKLTAEIKAITEKVAELHV